MKLPKRLISRKILLKLLRIRLMKGGRMSLRRSRELNKLVRRLLRVLWRLIFNSRKPVRSRLKLTSQFQRHLELASQLPRLPKLRLMKKWLPLKSRKSKLIPTRRRLMMTLPHWLRNLKPKRLNQPGPKRNFKMQLMAKNLQMLKKLLITKMELKMKEQAVKLKKLMQKQLQLKLSKIKLRKV